MMTEPFGQRQLDGAAIGATASAAQAFADGRDGVVGAEGGNQVIGVKLYRVSALVADRQEGVALVDVGEGDGHGSILVTGLVTSTRIKPIKQPDVWTFGFMPLSHLGIPI